MALPSWQLGSTTAQTATQDFFYDAQGNPYAVKYNGTLYYYITNLQGDVLHIVDTSGNTVVSYTYSPYGKPLTTTGSLASTLGAANPLRYRGYYFDSDSGLYYLQSRYYDPEIGRFINADSYVSTGQGIIGCNMFAYCNNNPMTCTDENGKTASYANDPAGELGRMIGEWIWRVIETDEDEVDENGQLTTNAVTKRLGKSIYRNLDCSAGLGMGFELSADIVDVVAAGIGMHGDMISVHLSKGELSYGQEYSSGVSISAFFHNIGFVESAYNKYFEYGEMEVSRGFWGDETLTLLAGSFYFGMGASFRIGFDLTQFCIDLDSIFD